ncbi:hypothetical protein LGH74_07655 [Hymenobacter sp. BT178]|uniref:Uncharacterized protein n=1 Tax=Hymenobacter lucidus TaxID=2880930 RepID=A0ABS8ANR3_9BACT|nr:hypothetical protein [Hymenobacter lucidus]
MLLFLYNTVGFYPAYTWRQHQFRREAEHQRRAQLPDAALTRVQVARTPLAGAELQWQEANEFRWRGQLYDVVRQRADADSITYFCWHDQGEEKLLAGLQKHLDQLTHPDQSAGKTARKLFDHLFKLAFFPVSAPDVAVTVRPMANRSYHHLEAALLTWPATIVLPPPESWLAIS